MLLVEREANLAALAAENVRANDLGDRVRVVATDILASGRVRRAAGLERGSADLVVSNPPFLDPASSRASTIAARAAAHVAGPGGLDAWLSAACDLLRPRGRIAFIHRADALERCLGACDGRFGSLAIRPVHPRAGMPASRILVTGRRGSRAALVLLPPLILHDASGAFLPFAAALHAGAATLVAEPARVPVGP